MEKTFCDMCRKEFTEADRGEGVFMAARSISGRADLCIECAKKVTHFIETYWENEGRER